MTSSISAPAMTNCQSLFAMESSLPAILKFCRWHSHQHTKQTHDHVESDRSFILSRVVKAWHSSVVKGIRDVLDWHVGTVCRGTTVIECNGIVF